MRALRDRRRVKGLKELRLLVPDAQALSVRERVARGVAALNAVEEDRALKWTEAVSEFDNPQ